MSTIGIRALKQNASEVVRQVVAGEIVTVTDRGRPVARLVPLETSGLQALIEDGRARSARATFADLSWPPPSGDGLSVTLEAMRGDERF